MPASSFSTFLEPFCPIRCPAARPCPCAAYLLTFGHVAAGEEDAGAAPGTVERRLAAQAGVGARHQHCAALQARLRAEGGGGAGVPGGTAAAVTHC